MRHRELALGLIPQQQTTSSIASELRGHWCVALAWTGRYLEAEQSARAWLQTLRDIGEINFSGPLRDLGFSLGMQGKFEEAYKCFSEAVENVANALHKEDSGSNAFWGATLIKDKCFQEAQDHLILCWQLAIQPATVWNNDLPYIYWLGTLHEIQMNWQKSAQVYAMILENKWIGRRYFECGALTGLVRVKRAQDDYVAIPSLFTEADQLAQQYEYTDHLASLRLTQAQVVWDGKLAEWGYGFASVLHYFQYALIYALHYNRFLLDEVLWGNNVATPLCPIIPHCLERGKEGKHMLVALRDWWTTGTSDIGGAPRSDTISPIPEGIALLEAEHIVRNREPGDGMPQKTVAERLDEAALQELD